MDTPAPSPNPFVSVVFYEDGELAVEFCTETGILHEYHFDNPELMQGIAMMFRRAAVDAQLIRNGLATFAELAHHWGGIAEDEDHDPLTYADFERFLAEQEGNDDDR